MAATVADQRTIIDELDAIGTWTGSPSLQSADPAPIEATYCLAFAVSNATVDAYETYSAINFSAGQTPGPSLIYIWFTHRAALDIATNAGCAMIIGDGTNRIAYHIAGSDVAVFRHDVGPAYWQCMVLDTANRPVSYTVILGSEAALNWSAITRIGIRFKTLAKAIGGAVNCFIDIIRRGAIGQGLRIKGGTSGVPGVFLDVSTADRAITDQKAFGILRRLSVGVYGCQGPLSFGSDGAAAAWFEDSNVVLVFEARGMDDNKYKLVAFGNASYETHLTLNSCVIKSAGPGVECTFTDQYITELDFNSCTFADLKNKIYFTNTAAATGHSVTGCVFTGCGQIDPGDVTFTGNTIANTTDADGGLLIDADGTVNISDLSFVSDGTGHAIYIPPGAIGEYTFTNFAYSGYGANESTDAVVYNNSGGAITINVQGGDTPTVRNGSGASTTINNSVTLKVLVVDANNAPVENAQVAIYKSSDDAELMKEGTETVTAGSFIIGDRYKITFVGTTDFTAIGASANEVGIVFVATGVGEGTGTATNGIATQPFNYPGSTVDIYVRVRRSSTGTIRYFPINTIGTITADGYSLTATMIKDEIVAA